MKNSFARKPARPNSDVPLFDNTRDQSLYQLRASGDVEKRQGQVFEAMTEIGRPCTAKEIAAHLHWPINCITGRIAELRDVRLLIEKCGTVPGDRNRPNNLYRIINPINASRSTPPTGA